MKHPMQKLEKDEHGTIRFRRNKIVEHLAVNELNELSTMGFPAEDWEQLAQLIGYSVSGFSTLSYASDKVVKKAFRKADKLLDTPTQ